MAHPSHHPVPAQPTPARSAASLRFVWLEITSKCQLECVHCYADSRPAGTHGTMASDDWRHVITQAAGCGAQMVQFIGGEPTLHPGLPALIDYALECGMEVEVFSNLVHVPGRLWQALERPGVRLATSFYSDDSREHAAITQRTTYTRTRDNIAHARQRGIQVRVVLVDILPTQRSAQARQELASLGIDEIAHDDLRGVGRGAPDETTPGVSVLCGRCANGNLAIAPDGTVWPCVFTRWMPVGNVTDHALEDILTSVRLLDTPDGVRSQLLVIARMQRSVHGDYPALVDPLHRLADDLTRRQQPSC